MTDVNLESNLPEGSTGSPNQNASQGQGVQPPSGFNAEQLLQLLEPLIEKKVQSVKDKRIAELEKTVSGFQPVLERFKGIVPDDKLQEIQRDLEFEDLKKRVYGENPTSQPAGGNQQSVAASDAAKVVDSVLELPANDARVTDLKLKYGNDLASYLREGMKLKSQLSTNPPTPAEMPLPPGKAPSADTAAQIEKGYLEEAAKVQRGNVFQLNEVKKKWRAKAREAGLQLNV